MSEQELTAEEKKKKEDIERIQREQGAGKEAPGPEIKAAKSIEFSTKGVYQSIFNQMLVTRYGEKWALSPAELEGISKATDDLLVKYAPYMAKWGAEINFGFWLFLILSPRLEYKQPEQPEKTPGEKTPGAEEKVEKKGKV